MAGNSKDSIENRAALVRVLGSPQFAKRPRLSTLLQYLFDSPRSKNQLTTIGHMAIEMNATPDAARQLLSKVRMALEEYYRAEGTSDPVKISVVRRDTPAVYELSFSLTNARPVDATERGVLDHINRLTAQISIREADVKASTTGAEAQQQARFNASTADFEVHFSSDFEPEEIKDLLTAFADYFRACGGAGFEVALEEQEASISERVHV